jgi:hypothetical protein
MIIVRSTPCKVCGAVVKTTKARAGWTMWCDKQGCLITGGHKTRADARAVFADLEVKP